MVPGTNLPSHIAKTTHLHHFAIWGSEVQSESYQLKVSTRLQTVPAAHSREKAKSLVHFLEYTYHPWLVDSSFISKHHDPADASPAMSFPLLSFHTHFQKEHCEYTGFSTESVSTPPTHPTLQRLNLISPAQSLLPYKATYLWVPRIGRRIHRVGLEDLEEISSNPGIQEAGFGQARRLFRQEWQGSALRKSWGCANILSDSISYGSRKALSFLLCKLI